MSMLGMYKAFNALNSDDIQDLVEYATDYLKDLPDEKILSASFQDTIKVAEKLLTYMRTRLENAKARSRDITPTTQGGN